MKQNNLNQIVIDQDDFVEVLYRDQQLSHLVTEQTDWIEKFSHACALFEMPVSLTWEKPRPQTFEEYVEECLDNWHLPEQYEQFDIENYLLSKCTTEEQIQRIKLELHEFKRRNMIKVLRFLKYFVDTLKSHNMIWGVGRGSSVASYVLYLLEVHRVDSLAYNLEIEEFLK